MAVIATGGYVMYKDKMRYPRMMERFDQGHILPPLDDNKHEPQYYHRPVLEQRLKHVMNPTFANEYYLVKGEVGTGKSRLVKQMVKERMLTAGSSKEGAPIYVLASQGHTFADTLAKAVNFLFDEHINFSFFLDFILRINSVPSREGEHRISRVLYAIEEAAYLYVEDRGRPVVLIIDGVEWLAKHMPSSLEKIQEKAKLWSDANIVKLILVSNDEKTDTLLQKNQSCWQRAEAPIYVNDLEHDEAISFLLSDLFPQENNVGHKVAHMTKNEAEKVYSFVGGRVQYLLIFKRDWIENIPFEVTANRMEIKEREKFLDVPTTPTAIKALELLSRSKDQRIHIHQLLAICPKEELVVLAQKNIVKIRRTSTGTKVLLESRLTEKILARYLPVK